MKKIASAAVITLFILAAVGSALAAGTIAPQVNVTGSVLGTCNIVTSPGAMSFTIDPSAAGPFNAVVATQPVIKCTKNHPYTVSCASTNTFHLNQGADSIPYNFTCPSNGNGNGFGAAGNITLTVDGQVTTGYADAAAGIGYSDTVTITINY